MQVFDSVRMFGAPTHTQSREWLHKTELCIPKYRWLANLCTVYTPIQLIMYTDIVDTYVMVQETCVRGPFSECAGKSIDFYILACANILHKQTSIVKHVSTDTHTHIHEVVQMVSRFFPHTHIHSGIHKYGPYTLTRNTEQRKWAKHFSEFCTYTSDAQYSIEWLAWSLRSRSNCFEFVSHIIRS